MKNLSDIPPDIATEAAAFFADETSFNLTLEDARKAFTTREQEKLFQELLQREITEAAALAFIIFAGFYSGFHGYRNILEHCREATPAPDMVKALGDTVSALDTALKLPKIREALEKVPYTGNWSDGEGNLFPCEVFATYTAPPGISPVPPQPLNLPDMMAFLKGQLELVEIESRRGPKVRIHRRRIVQDVAKQWERITGEAPTISDGCGFLYAMGIIWKATGRAALAHIEGRKRYGWTLPRGVDLTSLKLGADDLRNDLRAILKENKQTPV
jgi:hypothetical protein